jgi:hypothetical protein
VGNSVGNGAGDGARWNSGAGMLVESTFPGIRAGIQSIQRKLILWLTNPNKKNP